MKGLFFLYNYFPKNSANAIQNQRFIEGLKSIGIIPTIFTKKRESKDNIIEICDRYSNNLNYLARHTIPQMAYLPDIEKITWNLSVKRKLEKVLSVENYDFIHTNSLPHSSHELGAYYKKKYGIPWVAHFYEAWTDNYYKNFKYGFVKKLNNKQEFNVVQNADLIIHTNPFLQELWVQKYGSSFASKIKVLSLCTDEEIRTEYIHTSKSEKFIITHAGGLYGERNLNLFIDSLKILFQRNNQIKNRIEINIIGIISPKDRQRIINEGLQDIFIIHGRKPYHFVMKTLSNSNALLIIDSMKPETNLFFPSKICEYFSYQLPIIGIASKRSSVNYHLSKAGHPVFGKYNKLELSNFIEELVLSKNSDNFDKDYYQNFLPSHIANEYKKMIEKIL